MVHKQGFLLISALLVTSLPSPAKSLKDLLQAERIPLTSFGAAELGSTLRESVVLSNPQQETLAYTLSGSTAESSTMHVLKFDRRISELLKSAVRETDACSGGLESITAVDNHLLISTSISPSAQCQIVLDKNLMQTETLYGFGPERVGPDQIVLTENMIHFAPVHAERLQFADLRRRVTAELYPPKGDVLRSKLARENARNMPPAKVCQQMNDPCAPELFDESISRIATDGEGRFAFIVNQSANHATAPDEAPTTTASQNVLYIYSHGNSGWLYCEDGLGDSEAEMLTNSWQFGDAEGRCAPKIPVVPDMSTAFMNPFMPRRH
ncbi:MAG: hypothetical protein WBD10_04845 [Acidobacteriaceae bacterium]